MANSGTAVGLLLDTGHLAYAGGGYRSRRRVVMASASITSIARISGPRCCSRARQGDQSFLAAILDGVFTVPGDGMIDYYAFARCLAETGYQGWVVVEAEQDPAKAPPGEYSAMGRRHLAEPSAPPDSRLARVSAMIRRAWRNSPSPARSPSSPAGPRVWARPSPICWPSAAPQAS